MDITSASRSRQEMQITLLGDPFEEGNLGILLYFLISYNRDWSDLKTYIVSWYSNTNVTELVYLEWEEKTDLDSYR